MNHGSIDPAVGRGLIALFFGDHLAEAWSPNDPHILLGVGPEERRAEVILTALRERLAQAAAAGLETGPHLVAMQSLLKQAASAMVVGQEQSPQRISDIIAQRQVQEQSALDAAKARLGAYDVVGEQTNPPDAPDAPADLLADRPPPLPRTSAIPGNLSAASRPAAPSIMPGSSPTSAPGFAAGGNPARPSPDTPLNAPPRPPTNFGAPGVSPAASRGPTPMSLLTDRAAALLAQRGQVDAALLAELRIIAGSLGLPLNAPEQVIRDLSLRADPAPGPHPVRHSPDSSSRPAAHSSPSPGSHADQAASMSARPVPARPALAPELSDPVDHAPPDDPASRLLKRLAVASIALVMLCVIALGAVLIRAASSGGAAAAGGGGAGGGPAGGGATGTPTAQGPNSGNTPTAQPIAASAAPAGTSSQPTGQPSVPPGDTTKSPKASKPPRPGASSWTGSAIPTPELARTTLKALRDAAEVAPASSSGAVPAAQPTSRNTTVTNAVRLFLVTWPRLSLGERAASLELAIDAIHTLDSAGQSELLRSIGTLPSAGAPVLPSEVLPLAGSGGLLGRLLRDRELPVGIRAEVRTLYSNLGLPGTEAVTFDAGSGSLLRSMPLRLLAAGNSPQELKQAWLAFEIAAAASSGTPSPGIDPGSEADAARTAAEPFLLDALEQLLRGGPDALASRPMHDGLDTLGGRERWADGTPARQRLINWFDDRSIPTAKLAIVTAAIAKHSGADGVDLTMSLSTTADIQARDAMRARYAEAWKLTGAPPPATHIQWQQRTQLLADMADTDAQRLLATAITADVNRALAAAVTGAGGGEPILPEKLDATLSAAAISQANGGLPISFVVHHNTGGPSDDGWGIRFLAERSSALRMDLLRQVDTLGTLSPVDADVLVDTAVFGSGSEIRTLASKAVAKRTSEPLVLVSLLEVLPKMGRSRSNGELVSVLSTRQLPDVDAPEYPLAARRAVVERLLDLLATGTPINDVEGQASKLGEQYRLMAGLPVPPAANAVGSNPPAAGSGPGALPADAAKAMYAALRARALLLPAPRDLGYSLADADLRAAAREASGSGPVQRFAAWQASLCEMIGLFAASDRPACAAQVQQVLTDWSAKRRLATNITQQIMHTELAITRVWLAWEANR